MPTAIQANGKAGRRAKRVGAARRLRNILGDLRTANQNWDTLTSAQIRANQRDLTRAMIAILDDYIDSKNERSGRLVRPERVQTPTIGQLIIGGAEYDILPDGARRLRGGS